MCVNTARGRTVGQTSEIGEPTPYAAASKMSLRCGEGVSVKANPV